MCVMTTQLTGVLLFSHLQFHLLCFWSDVDGADEGSRCSCFVFDASLSLLWLPVCLSGGLPRQLPLIFPRLGLILEDGEALSSWQQAGIGLSYGLVVLAQWSLTSHPKIYINKKKQQRGFGGAACLKHDALLRLRQLAFSGELILSHFVWHFQRAAGFYFFLSFILNFVQRRMFSFEVLHMNVSSVHNTTRIYISLVHCYTRSPLKE